MLSTRVLWLLAAVLLVMAGAIYRALATRLEPVAGRVTLPVPLDAYARRIEEWVGEDVPIPLNIQEVAGNDAYLHRRYRNRVIDHWVNLYIAYTAQPRTMLGHRPRVCYVANGWIHDGTVESELTTRAGRTLSCLIHRFHKPPPDQSDVVVLSFYIVNGRVTCDHKALTGVGWRTPNIDGDPAWYVTQVQISSSLENSTRAAARDMAELILDFFPDENGLVKAVEYVEDGKDLEE